MKKTDLEKKAEKFVKKYNCKKNNGYAMDIYFLQIYEKIKKNDEFKKIIKSRKMLSEFVQLPNEIKQIVLGKVKQIDIKNAAYNLSATEILKIASIEECIGDINFWSISLEPGTILYRIIKEEVLKKYDNPWDIPPKSAQGKGRFDHNYNILYVSTDLSVIEQECGLKKDDIYYLGKYEVLKRLSIGSLFSENPYAYIYQKICQAEHCKNFSKIDKNLLKHNMKLNNPLVTSLQLGVLAGNELYKYTNRIGNKIIQSNPDGIRYCSSYNPVEIQIGNTVNTITDGIEEANYAITQKGVEKLQFIGYKMEIVKNDRNDYIPNLVNAVKNHG